MSAIHIPIRLARTLVVIVFGVLVGASIVYFSWAKRWREERDDLFMIQIEWLLKQGQRAHQQDSGAIARDTDMQLLVAVTMIDENFSHHPGARYWVEKIARYTERNGMPFPSDLKRVLEKLSATRQATDRVFYRWQ